MTTELSTDNMLADIAIVFPTLWTRRLSEFGSDYAGQEGIWTGADGDCMPGGEPLFSTMANGEAPYNGPVHEGFERWLENRGWAWEQYDGATFFLIPISAFAEPEGCGA